MAPRWFGTFGASLGAALSKQGFAPQETAAARVSRGSSPSLPLNRHTRRQPHPKSPCATLRTDDPAFRLVFVCVVVRNAVEQLTGAKSDLLLLSLPFLMIYIHLVFFRVSSFLSK